MQKGSTAATLILVVAAFIAGGILGAVIAKILSPVPSTTQAPVIQKASVDKNIFNSQTAVIQGVITSVANKTLTVKNNLGTATFATDDKVYIQNMNKKSATSSADLNSIELNKESLINFRLDNDKFVVVSITVLPSSK